VEREFEGILFAEGECRDVGPELVLKEKQDRALRQLLIPMTAAIGAAADQIGR
jgi:hypothetical protein